MEVQEVIRLGIAGEYELSILGAGVPAQECPTANII